MGDLAPIPVLLDTDLGGDIDDALALAVCLNHPRLDLRGVVTVHGDTELRAAQVRYLLALSGRGPLPVAAGSRDPLDGHAPLDRSYQAQADVLPPHEEERWREGRADGVRLLAELALANPGATLLAIGPLTNVARLRLEFPAAFAGLGRLAIMGGHRREDLSYPEYNFSCDPRAAQVVLAGGKSILLVGLDVTLRCRMTAADVAHVAGGGTPLSSALTEMIRLWQGPEGVALPVLHDPLVALALAEPEVLATEPQTLRVDDQGWCLPMEGPPNVEFAVEVQEAQAVASTVALLR